MPAIQSLQIGEPRTHSEDGDPSDPFTRPWVTAFYKQRVAGPVDCGPFGLDGDGVADTVNHGGADKAVCAYPADHYPHWRETLGLDLPGGAFGENLTVAGLVEEDVCIGDIWRTGSALLQLSQPRQPCWKLGRRWGIPDFAAYVVETGFTGWYFRVLQPGTLDAGQSLTLIERPQPNWTARRANEVMHFRKYDDELNATLAGLPELSQSWRLTLRRRISV